MATDVERLVVSLEANVKAFEREMRRSRQVTEQSMRGIEQRTAAMTKRVDGLMSGVGKSITAGFRNAAGLAGAFLSVSAVKQWADAWTEAGNKIRAAGEQSAIAARRQDELADIAIRSRADFGSVVDLYTGISRATQELGVSQADAARVTETIAKAFTVGGQSAATAAGAITQLNQAFSAGKLSGDELNSVLEGAPPLARLIAKEFGVSVGQLKKLAEDGKLTADKVFGAILKGTKDIEQQFAVTVPTIAQSFVNLETAMVRYVGKASEAGGASAQLAKAINSIALNIDTVAPAAAILGAALLAFSAGGPIAAGVAAVGTAFYLLGDSIRPISGDLATLADYASVAFDMASTMAESAATSIQQAFARAADLITSALETAGTDSASAFDALLTAVKSVVNATIGTFVFAVETIKATWNTLGFALAETIISAMNAVIAAVEGAVGKIAASVNSITSVAGNVGVNIPQISAPQLGRITNSYAGAGAAAGQAFVGAAGALTRDYVGDLGRGAANALGGVRAAAGARAEDRAEQARRAGQLNYSPQRPNSVGGPRTAGSGGDDGGKKGKKGAGDKEDEFEREVAAIEKRTRAFGAEQAALGRSAIEAAKAEASFRLLEAAKKAGVAITPELTAKVDALATAYATAKVKLDEAQEAQKAFQSAMSEIGNTLADAFKDAVLEGEKLSDVLKKLAKSFAAKAIDKAFDSLFSSGGKDGGGGILGSLMSFFTGGSGAVPGRAVGGPVSANKPYMVGERGPELMVPRATGTVIPNKKLGGGGAASPSLTIVQNIAANGDKAVAQIAYSAAQSVVQSYDRGVAGRVTTKRARY